MERLTRCTHCFNEIHRGVRSCPHCDHPRGRGPRLLGRGSLTFIAVWITLFAFGDTVYLLNQRKLEIRRDGQGIETATTWLRAWLSGDRRGQKDHGSEGEAFRKALARLREGHADYLPTSGIEAILVTPHGSSTRYPDPHRAGRVLHRDCRVYRFEAQGRHGRDLVELGGRIWVRGNQGPGEVVSVEIERVGQWPEVDRSDLELHGAGGRIAIELK